MKYLLSAAALLVSAQSFAALPPYYDSANKIKTVLESSELGKKVSGHITIITYKGSSEFLVNTEFCEATVILETEKPKSVGGKIVVGAATYKVKSVDKVTCE
jgi:hypothetical protein